MINLKGGCMLTGNSGNHDGNKIERANLHISRLTLFLGILVFLASVAGSFLNIYSKFETLQVEYKNHLTLEDVKASQIINSVTDLRSEYMELANDFKELHKDFITLEREFAKHQNHKISSLDGLCAECLFDVPNDANAIETDDPCTQEVNGKKQPCPQPPLPIEVTNDNKMPPLKRSLTHGKPVVINPKAN